MADNCPASFLDHKGIEMINDDLKGWVVRYASYLILTKVTPFSARISLHQNFLLDLEVTRLQDFEYQGCQRTCIKKSWPIVSMLKFTVGLCTPWINVEVCRSTSWHSQYITSTLLTVLASSDSLYSHQEVWAIILTFFLLGLHKMLN